MFSFVSLICSIVGLILGGIVSYHVTLAAAPDYMAMWWISYFLVFLSFVFGVAAKAAGEDV